MNTKLCNKAIAAAAAAACSFMTTARVVPVRRHIYLLLTVFAITIIISQTVQARRLLPCELAGQMYILDVPKKELPLWLCIAEYESRFNTHVVGARNLDGSLDYGLFQISDRFWCQPENKTEYYTFNECLVNCTNLVLDDITAAVKCAQLIRKQQGWSAWTVYEEFCNDTLPDIEHCFT